MNIKIPYHLIGRLEDKEFVSFILDKDQTAIHRIDFTRNNNPTFFTKKLEFVTVDDQHYKNCDSIIFFPFLKNGKGWGQKIVLNKNKNEFVKINGGIEYIKNPDMTGDQSLLKDWIKSGLEFQLVEQTRGNKNLMYFSVFGKNYIELLKVLASGLVAQTYRNFDILFITDKHTKPLISKLNLTKHFVCDYMLVEKQKDPVFASMQKIKIFEYKKINDYKKILFLDLDILVVGNVGSVFEKKLYPNKLYSAAHRYNIDAHNNSYNTICDYANPQINRFDKFNIFPFNAGQFIFLNTPTIEDHFNNIKKFIKIWNGKFFFEQSFMNTYFNTLHLSDVFKFKDEFNFILINSGDKEYRLNPDSVFVHYIGCVANAKDKYKFIKINYKHLLPEIYFKKDNKRKKNKRRLKKSV